MFQFTSYETLSWREALKRSFIDLGIEMNFKWLFVFQIQKTAMPISSLLKDRRRTPLQEACDSIISTCIFIPLYKHCCSFKLNCNYIYLTSSIRPVLIKIDGTMHGAIWPVTMPPGHTPVDLHFFFLLWWSIAYPRARRRKEFPTPELLIDLIYFFFWKQ